MSPKRKGVKKSRGKIDVPFLILVIVILLCGLLMMFSAGFVDGLYRKGNSFVYIGKQGLCAVIGIVAMLIITFVFDYHILHKFAVPIMFVTLALLAVVYACPEVNGVHRWIPVPVIGSFQPSELAKFAIIALFSHMISLNYNKMGTFKGVLPFFIISIIVVVAIALERHISGGIIVALICAVMLYIGGMRVYWFAVAAGLGGAFGVVMYFAGKLDSVLGRLKVFFDPFVDARDVGYQNIQALYAISSGGLMGVGLGNSRQKYLYIPEPQNDFIFAIVCEEVGFVGAAVILILFALLVWRGFVIASKSKDKFGTLLVIGIVSQVGLQVIFNVAVVTKLVPNTGIPLPFFSYGGTALLMLLAEMGVVLNVSRVSSIEKT